MIQIESASDFSHVIGLIKSSKRSGRDQYSYSELAKKLGYKSPRLLAMIHKSQRAPSEKLVKRTAELLKLTAREKEFLSLLAEKTSTIVKNKNSTDLDEKINHLRSKPAYLELTNRDLEIFSDPVFLTVKQILHGNKGALTALEIRDLILDAPSLQNIHNILDYLLRLGFCKLQGHDRYILTNKKFIKTTSQIPSHIIQRLHHENVKRALSSLNRPVTDREFLTGAFCVKSEDWPKLRRRMNEFLFEILEEYGATENADHVFQINLQAYQQARLKK